MAFNFNARLLMVLQLLFMVNEAILVVRLAQNDAPTPAEALDLADTLSDLEMIKFELNAQRIQIENETASFPPPPPGAMEAISALLVKVEQARLEGTAVSARLAVTRQVLSMAITLLS